MTTDARCMPNTVTCGLKEAGNATLSSMISRQPTAGSVPRLRHAPERRADRRHLRPRSPPSGPRFRPPRCLGQLRLPVGRAHARHDDAGQGGGGGEDHRPEQCLAPAGRSASASPRPTNRTLHAMVRTAASRKIATAQANGHVCPVTGNPQHPQACSRSWCSPNWPPLCTGRSRWSGAPRAACRERPRARNPPVLRRVSAELVGYGFGAAGRLGAGRPLWHATLPTGVAAIAGQPAPSRSP